MVKKSPPADPGFCGLFTKRSAKKSRVKPKKRLPTGMASIQSYRKQKIPKALRESVWIHHCGKVFERACLTSWCQNRINAFNFQAGHNIPESKGGTMAIDNLLPICSRCNLSMGNKYTFSEWTAKFRPVAPEFPRKSLWKRLVGFFRPRSTILPTV